MSLAFFIYVLFISLMQLVNWAQFLNTISLLLFYGFATVVGAGAIVIVPLKSIYKPK